MANFKAILRNLCEGDGEMYDDDMLPPLDDENLGKEPEIDTTYEEEPLEDDDSDILLGSAVLVQDVESFTAKELGITDEEFEDFTTKVEDGEVAIVFDIDDDDPSLVDIVFEDGLEIFKLPKLMLKVTEFDQD